MTGLGWNKGKKKGLQVATDHLERERIHTPILFSPNLNPNFSLDLVWGPASPTMTRDYQDLQHLDNEENDHQVRRGEGRRHF